MQMGWKIILEKPWLPGAGIPGTGMSLSPCHRVLVPWGWGGGGQPWDPHSPFPNSTWKFWKCPAMRFFCSWGGFPRKKNPWTPLPRDVYRVRLSQTQNSHLQPRLEIPGMEIQAGRVRINMGSIWDQYGMEQAES